MTLCMRSWRTESYLLQLGFDSFTFLVSAELNLLGDATEQEDVKNTHLASGAESV